SFTVTSPTTIKAVTKTHAPGTVTVKVTTAGGTATAGSDFKFVAPVPTITSFTPTTGTTSGTTTVTITGTGFSGTGFSTTAVKFGTTTAKSFTVTSSTTIRAVTKPHVALTVKVKVTTVGGTATSVGSFKFVAPVPTIASFTPATGTTSGTTTVTISGTGLYGATTVKFGTTAAKSFTVTSPTTIKAVTKPHVAGTVTVKVTTAGGTATAGSAFRFVAPLPTVTSFAPTYGSTSGTTTVTITGTGFYGATVVKFGTTTAKSFTVTSPTTIKAVTKPHPAGTVTVKVTTAGGTATSIGDFKFLPPPTITSFSPTAGSSAGGTTVTITGTSLTFASAVKFGTTTAASFTVTGPTTITAVTRAHASGTVTIAVTGPGGTGSSPTKFTFAPAPTVSSLNPTEGSGNGFATVTITGTNFKGTGYSALSVKFGTTPAASFTVTSSTTIKAITKPHVAGTVKVKVTTAGGTATSTGSYRFVTPPTITSFSPATGPIDGGTAVTIVGTGFGGASKVQFGTTTAASYRVTSTTQITAFTHAHAAGAVNVSVTTLGGQVTSVRTFDFLSTPKIISITPTSGSTSGGTTVTIEGADLDAVRSVSFGGSAATTIREYSSTKIVVKDPAHAAGTVTVAVTTSGGSATEPAAFAYVVPKPTISAVDPDEGLTTGGTVVTIGGQFLNTATSVTFGTVPGTSIQVVSPTDLKVKTPAHVPGRVTVKVTTSNGTATKLTAFSFISAPPLALTFVSGASCYKNSNLVCVAAGATMTGSVLIEGTKKTTGSFSWTVTRAVTSTKQIGGLIASDLPVSVADPALPSGSFVACTGSSGKPCTSVGPLYPLSDGYSVAVGSCQAELQTGPTAISAPGTTPTTFGPAETLPLGFVRLKVVNSAGQPVSGASVRANVEDPEHPTCNTATLLLGTTGRDGTLAVSAIVEVYKLTVTNGHTTVTVPTFRVAPSDESTTSSTTLLPSSYQVTL
ncbi:MAG: IPT/TIG domain-containing protein, partial [Acidimicrobiales bacterium]